MSNNYSNLAAKWIHGKQIASFENTLLIVNENEILL